MSLSRVSFKTLAFVLDPAESIAGFHAASSDLPVLGRRSRGANLACCLDGTPLLAGGIPLKVNFHSLTQFVAQLNYSN